MARIGKRVLVLDCDNQRNSFRFFSDVADNGSFNSTRYKNLDIMCYKAYIPDSYDYAILDLPPALNEDTKQILSKCDYVFVPIELGTFAISGIANVTETIAATRTESGNSVLGGCFVNKFDRKNPADYELDKLLRQNLGGKVLVTRIPNSRVIKNSISYRQTAFEYMRWMAAAKAYTTLTYEIMGICEKGRRND
jgi:chromosome partitioning protein